MSGRSEKLFAKLNSFEKETNTGRKKYTIDWVWLQINLNKNSFPCHFRQIYHALMLKVSIAYKQWKVNEILNAVFWHDWRKPGHVFHDFCMDGTKLKNENCFRKFQAWVIHIAYFHHTYARRHTQKHTPSRTAIEKNRVRIAKNKYGLSNAQPLLYLGRFTML